MYTMTTNQENKRHFFQLSHKNKHRIRVYRGDLLLADTQNALLLKEVGKAVYDGVYYIPEVDLKMEYFSADSELSTTCPIKGDASYLNFKGEEETIENLAWTYKEPLSNAKRLQNHYAFYDDKVSFRIDPL